MKETGKKLNRSGVCVSRITLIVLVDILMYLVMAALFYVLSQRAAGSMELTLSVFGLNAAIQLVLILICRTIARVYKSIWRYANASVYLRLVAGDAVAGVLTVALIHELNKVLSGVYVGLWQAVAVGSLTALLTLISRFVYALVYRGRKQQMRDAEEKRIPVAIVGAGRLGSLLADELEHNSRSEFTPMFFVDTDLAKIGQRVNGHDVYDPESASDLIARLGIKEVIITITGSEQEELERLYFHYANLGCHVRIYETLVSNSPASGGTIRDFAIEDLLFRKTVDMESDEAGAYYRGKTVLITGGGGSIGSELCRQVAHCRPKKLVVFDIYENNAYEIQQELKFKLPELDLCVEIGSVRDRVRMDELFAAYRPEVVFHAAAHKHVPLIEHNGAEAVKNNVLGTKNTADMAEKYGTEKFILISTDKAVNPTNVMGASKRVCEMVVQCRTDSATAFSAVRFGNVLGSNGSVIPLFRRQIENGGPVTLTDKRIVRYFMTIPEASQLVMMAGAMAKRGELFVLDMGKPVRIYDLAINMIRLSGLEPGKDIPLKEIGLRPGEKLYEELLMKNEDLTATDNDRIFIERDAPLTRAEVDEKIRVLTEAVECGGNIREAMRAVVPTFCDPEVVNASAEEAEEMKAQAEKELVGSTT